MNAYQIEELIEKLTEITTLIENNHLKKGDELFEEIDDFLSEIKIRVEEEIFSENIRNFTQED